METIPNSQLIEKDLPSRRAAWKSIVPFALTFNGYKHWGSFKKCREVATLGLEQYRKKKKLAQPLTDLRTCLFFEVRRWKHFEKNPSKEGMLYIRALLEEIRLRVHAREFV